MNKALGRYDLTAGGCALLSEYRQQGAGRADASSRDRGSLQKIRGRMPMQGQPEQHTSSSIIAVRQRTSNELVRLIRKLRWARMEKEAQVLAEELKRRCATDTISVISQPRETD